jgi:hypothetical protein
MDSLTLLGSPEHLLVGNAAHGLRKRFPNILPEQFLASPPPELLGLVVEVGEAPLMVRAKKASVTLSRMVVMRCSPRQPRPVRLLADALLTFRLRSLHPFELPEHPSHPIRLSLLTEH